MTDQAYEKLATVLDTLPNGFPRTESGVEIKLLQKIFTSDEADLTADLRLTYETVEQIAARTGRPLEGLAEKLHEMTHKGQIRGIEMGPMKIYQLLPWVFGIFEFQVGRMDREMAELNEEYYQSFGRQFFENKPPLMHVVPVEKDIPVAHQALPYEQVSAIIEKGQSFGLESCVCKKEKRLLDEPCDRPEEVCLGIAPVPGVFDDFPWGRSITKEQAYEVLRQAEENALVHLTYNMQNDQFFICNCCGCCCGVLRSINELGVSAAVNSTYYAEIDPEECTVCGTCLDERCQIAAIEEGEEAYRVLKDKCIGCGLCISTCPGEAISLVRKPEAEIVTPPLDQHLWYEARGAARGVDFSAHK
ncbi:MAG: 4Fe-4S binding protein [Proteobacteria bacterium]|nr:4Fe-4S binding protein [Pseudomonadota bacterium]